MRVTVSVFITEPLAYGRETVELSDADMLNQANKAKVVAAYESAIQSALKMNDTGAVNVNLHRG